MPGIMQHAGYLDDSENITQPAIKAFLDHRNAIINGDIDPFFQEEKTDPKDGIIINLEDKQRFPSFFEKWTNKLEIALKILNMQSNIQVPFFDTLALGSALNLDTPDLSFSSLMGILAVSTSSGPVTSFQIPLLTLKIEPNNIPDVIGKIKSDIIKLPKLPIASNFFPTSPSASFPLLEYPVPIFNLKDKQISIFTQIPITLTSVITEFLKIENLIKFASEGPGGLIKLSYEVVKNGFQRPPGAFNTSYDINLEAISRTLSKPVGITAIGNTIGSANNGITGNIGAQNPDPMKVVEQPASKCSQTLINAWVTPSTNLFVRTTPEFRRGVVDLCKRLEIPDPDWLIVCMCIETAGTWSPDVRCGEVRIISKKKSQNEKYNENELQSIAKKMQYLPGTGKWTYAPYGGFATQVLKSQLQYGQGVIKTIDGKTVLARVEPHKDNHPKLIERCKQLGIPYNLSNPRVKEESSKIPAYWHRGVTVYEKTDESAENPNLNPITPSSSSTNQNSPNIDDDDTKMSNSLVNPGSTDVESQTKEEDNFEVKVNNGYYIGNAGTAVGLVQFTTIAVEDLNQFKGFKDREFQVQSPTEKAKNKTRTVKGLTKEVLANMTQVQQLEIVEAYLSRAFQLNSVKISSGKQVNNIEGFYTLIFSPGLFKSVNFGNNGSDVLTKDPKSCSTNPGYVEDKFKVYQVVDGKKRFVKSKEFKGGIELKEGAYISRKMFLGKLYGIINESKLKGGRVCVDEQTLIPPDINDNPLHS